ncbi:MAG: hypothetical protein Q8M92_08165, partial [Candidatus Subteraquimicrobiales bacterium]|nr:hypothetical protein [Candidatus Subteraquimicrobiales bacterium]
MNDFLGQFKKLILDAPHLNVNSRNVENCPYGDFIYNCKNCYLCFDTGGSQKGYFLENSMKTRDCVDCSFARWSELCYECVNIEKCYSCNWCVDCNDSHDLSHCFDCSGCSDCYGCVGLRHKQYQIYNEQFTKEEYLKRIKNIKFDKDKFHELELEIPRQNLHLSRSEDCIGDYIYNSKKCTFCFDINNMEDCIYYISGNYNSPDKSCCDINEASGCELCYDSFSLGYCYNCNFLVESSYCTDCEFGFELEQCKNCFGCVYLKNKQYYILNKLYSKEDYLA